MPPRKSTCNEKTILAPLLEEATAALHRTWSQYGMSAQEQHAALENIVSSQLKPVLDSIVKHHEGRTQQMFLECARGSTAVHNIYNRMEMVFEEHCSNEQLKTITFDMGQSLVKGTTMTLGEVNTALQEELEVAKELANKRIDALRLVHKMRALLEEPPAKQKAVRHEYLEKLYGETAAEDVVALVDEENEVVCVVAEEQEEEENAFKEADGDEDQKQEEAPTMMADIEGGTEEQVTEATAFKKAAKARKTFSYIPNTRATVYPCFEADEVEAEGYDQDLSTVRINNLIEETVAMIAQHNEAMEKKIETDADAIFELWDRLGTAEDARNQFSAKIDELRKLDENAAMLDASQQQSDVASTLENVDSAFAAGLKSLLLATCPAETATAVINMRTQLEDEVFINAAIELEGLNTEVNKLYTRYHRISDDAAYANPANYGLWLQSVEHASLQERLDAVARGVEAAKTDIAQVSRRCELWSGASELYAEREGILERKATHAAEGPQRLQSRDRHAARRRMEEERLRNEVEIKLPRIEAKLCDMVKEWTTRFPSAPLMVKKDIVLKDAIAELIERDNNGQLQRGRSVRGRVTPAPTPTTSPTRATAQNSTRKAAPESEKKSFVFSARKPSTSAAPVRSRSNVPSARVASTTARSNHLQSPAIKRGASSSTRPGLRSRSNLNAPTASSAMKMGKPSPVPKTTRRHVAASSPAPKMLF